MAWHVAVRISVNFLVPTLLIPDICMWLMDLLEASDGVLDFVAAIYHSNAKCCQMVQLSPRFTKLWP
jgi:hypothetical protein